MLEAAGDRHGGTIEALSGDAITAVFGLPLVHEDDALRAMRAAVEALPGAQPPAPGSPMPEVRGRKATATRNRRVPPVD
jgi:class 3 adenylate cyclase